ncbi:MAG: UDP-N-acetylglucosamine 2-epimerase (non-hydrolyzing) [Bryobacterales bacterium]|nr:UDP-N-acetylglucosamine 2-epimerase (non-hydrolyzing) [Bryobacterales bacterium]
MKRVLCVLGTRPEAIKLAPLVLELRAHPESFETHLCSTGQHADLLEPVWRCFGIRPDTKLECMRPGQSLESLTARILDSLPAIFESTRPELVIVQGDTTTTLCAAQLAFYRRVPVVHIEAGLRTHNPYMPFPEEMNRTLVSRLASLHCAPTQNAAQNLLREGIPAERVHVTGNTSIDALQWVLGALDNGTLQPEATFPPSERKRVVATMHRRESFGDRLESVCQALVRLLAEHELELIVPLHPNPEAGARVASLLPEHPHLYLTAPLDYASFVALMRSADLLLTDSGGIQEEAPYLGRPVVVVRECTERPEGVAAGVASVVGFEPESILAACRAALFPAADAAQSPVRHGIYGDGSACRQIRHLIASFQGK